MQKNFVTGSAGKHALRDAKGIILIDRAVPRKSTNIREIDAKILSFSKKKKK